jgi:hypothetical protein
MLEGGTGTCVTGMDESTKILLGSPTTVKKVNEYLKAKGKDDAFTGFRMRVSAAVQALTLTP